MENKFIEIEETIGYGRTTRKVLVNTRHIRKIVQMPVVCGVWLSGKSEYFETKETAESLLQKITS